MAIHRRVPHSKGRLVQICTYILLWLGAVYFYWEILNFQQSNITNPILAGLYFVQFGIHEISHILFAFTNDVLAAAVGSISEVVVTSLVVLAAWQYRSYWLMVFGLLWVMLAMMSMANYMIDAIDRAMPLLGMVPDPVHDWHFVFSELGWLSASRAIGTTVKVIGWLVGASGLALGAWRITKVMKRESEVI